MSFLNKLLSHKDALFRLALSIMNNHHDAEDAVSEVFTKVWKQKQRFSQYDNLEKVLFTTTKNQCFDMLKARKHAKHLSDSIKEKKALNKSNPFRDDEKLSIIHSIIHSLPEKQKLMVHLRMVEGYSMEQIADVMDAKVNTVEVALSRARKKIRTEYENRKLRHR